MAHEDVFSLRVMANSSRFYIRVAEAEKRSYAILYEANDTYLHNFQYEVQHNASQVRYCLQNQEDTPIQFNITYKRGDEVVNIFTVAKREDLNQVHGEMETLQKVVDDYRRERNFALQRYDYMNGMQNSISKKQMAFSLFCVGFSLIVTVVTVSLTKRIIK